MSSFLKAAAATDPSLIQQGLFDHGRAFAALQHSAATTSDQPRPTSVSVRLPAISSSGTPTAASKFTTSGDRLLMSQSRNAEESSIRWKGEEKQHRDGDEADAVSMSSSQQSSWQRTKVDDPRSKDRTDDNNGPDGGSGDTRVGADVGDDDRPTTFSAARARRKSSKQAAGHTVNTFAVHGRPLVPPRPDGVGFFGESLVGRPAVSSGGGGGCPNPRFAPARVEEKQTQQQRRKAEERERRIERLHATQEQARVRLAQQCIAAAALSPLFHSPVQLSNPVLKHDVDDE